MLHQRHLLLEVPQSHITGVSSQQYRSLEFNVFPSTDLSASGSCEVYEDDGMTTDYLAGISARTHFHYGPASSDCTEYTISTTGTYANMVTDGREYSVFILASTLPSSVTVNGLALYQSQSDNLSGTWFFSLEKDLHVFLPPSSTTSLQTLLICF